MTITQLEYIVAVDTHKNFGQAADSCFVTQPTLSMQIQKLEDELDVIIFDRKKKPIKTTDLGISIIEQAQIALNEFYKIKNIINSTKGNVSGNVHIGIIPTIAPYLVPLFIISLTETYKDLNVTISEMPTAKIIEELAKGTIDCGILATPLENNNIIEHPIYYEPLVAYLAPKHKLYSYKTMDVENLRNEELLMLTEEHCLHSQIQSMCESSTNNNYRFKYTTGNLDTIIQMVDLLDGLTLLPKLAVVNFDLNRMDNVRYFRGTEPVREISVVTSKSYNNTFLIEAIKTKIAENVPKQMLSKTKKRILPIKGK